MIVCVCHTVSDRDIARAARSGCASFDELQFALGVATACGKCHDCARETFEHHVAPAGGGGAETACASHASPFHVTPVLAPRRVDALAPATA